MKKGLLITCITLASMLLVRGNDATVGAAIGYDKIWSLASLYHDKDNSVIQDFSLTGEIFSQWASGSSNQGSFGSADVPSASRWGEIDTPVFRIGFSAQMFRLLKLNAIIDVNPNWDPFYKDLYEVNLTYAPGESFNLGIGKQKGRYFSQEYSIRTRELLEFNQSLLVNTLVPRGLTGIWINGKVQHWTYALAAYAGDYEKEFTNFNAGAVIQASIGYDFAAAFGADKALLRLDYQGSNSGQNGFGPGKFDNALSINTIYQKGRFGFYTDLLGGTGRGMQGDVWGAIITPSWFIVEQKLQVIFRYQYAHGDNDGLKLQTRYESYAPGIQDTKGIGSEYNAAYVGLNWYLYGNKLKVMTGLEYSDMSGGPKNFSGWTSFSGLRVAF
ncbi:MAG: hypothetical protein K8R87_12860 [Verrucomicrobia bacterium]|nr:hypothetical protein [Verrucomicrobiota bacterium]